MKQLSKSKIKRFITFFTLLIVSLVFACTSGVVDKPKSKVEGIKSKEVNPINQNSIKGNKVKSIEHVSLNSIKNTIWEYQYSENIIDRYEFKSNSTYTFQSAELQEKFFGSYYISNDTIFATQIKSEFDENLSEGSVHKSKPVLFLLVLIEGKLVHLVRKNKMKDKWKTDAFRFPNDYTFQKLS